MKTGEISAGAPTPWGLCSGRLSRLGDRATGPHEMIMGVNRWTWAWFCQTLDSRIRPALDPDTPLCLILSSTGSGSSEAPPLAARTVPARVHEKRWETQPLGRARWLMQDWDGPEGTANNERSCLTPASAQQAQLALHAALGHLRRLGSQRSERHRRGRAPPKWRIRAVEQPAPGVLSNGKRMGLGLGGKVIHSYLSGYPEIIQNI